MKIVQDLTKMNCKSVQSIPSVNSNAQSSIERLKKYGGNQTEMGSNKEKWELLTRQNEQE
ncbi:MAG TPA: hypothetical protein ENJ28_09370 [Gammaproteobacteria bacterium]|nr:hypothetical protein [Gammaproteobacteria bacterium]